MEPTSGKSDGSSAGSGGIILPNHRAVQEVLYLVRCIIDDGRITLSEAHEFVKWVDDHPEIAVVPPIPRLARRLRAFLADGVLDAREHAEVLKAFRELMG